LQWILSTFISTFLHLARADHPLADIAALLAGAFGAQFTERDRRDLDVDVDAVEQRAADLLRYSAPRQGHRRIPFPDGL
jgi:hypothetical protein